MFQRNRYWLPMLVALVLTGGSAWASSGDSNHVNHAATLLYATILFCAAKLGGLVERFTMPPVLGELLTGVILGNLGVFGLHIAEPILSNDIIAFMAELGVILLLFQCGLESSVDGMMQVGGRALAVATVGVVTPFILGTWIVGPILLPDLSKSAYLFIGAALTATSVGLTARVFKDMNFLHAREAQIVIGAAVIDDVIGLVILAVVSAIAATGTVHPQDIATIITKAVLFLVLAIALGQRLAPLLGKIFSSISRNHAMKHALALIICFVLAYLAQQIGLAMIVGAFAAGLVLDHVHFKDFEEPEHVREIRTLLNTTPSSPLHAQLDAITLRHAKHHVDELTKPLANFFVPIFFVLVGMGVNLKTLTNTHILFVAIGITIVAILGKIAAGFAAGNTNRWIVGWGMVPRGEVGLIFASVGKGLNVITAEVYSVIVIMVIASTLLTPPMLTWLLKRNKHAQRTHNEELASTVL